MAFRSGKQLPSFLVQPYYKNFNKLSLKLQLYFYDSDFSLICSEFIIGTVRTTLSTRGAYLSPLFFRDFKEEFATQANDSLYYWRDSLGRGGWTLKRMDDPAVE